MSKTTVPSTQHSLNIAQIRSGVIITKTGLLRRVIHVEPVNFALKSDEDQTVIIGQYQNFLNSLNFPLQIVIHSRRLDVAPYLFSLHEKINTISNELLRFHALEYTNFIKSLTELANIMDKQFYCVVGFDPPAFSKTGLLGNLFGKKEQHKISFSAKEWEKHNQELDQRVELVKSGLNALGLKNEALDTQKTIELFYAVYNPEEASSEKLTETDSMQASVISTQVPTKQLANVLPNQAEALNEAISQPTDSSPIPSIPTQPTPPTNPTPLPTPPAAPPQK